MAFADRVRREYTLDIGWATAPLRRETYRQSRKGDEGAQGEGRNRITGVPLGELKDLATRLKQKCGTGGTVKGGVVEIQGDHRDVLIDLLSKNGWTVKRSGS